MMHRFNDPSIEYTWDRHATTGFLLEKCLKYLKKEKYNILSLSEIIEKIKNNETLERTVCFTVDDGYKDFKNIGFPLFNKYNIPVTVFITTDFISGNILMWYDTIEYLLIKSKLNKFSITIDSKEYTFEIHSFERKIDSAANIVKYCKKIPMNSTLDVISDLAEILRVPLPKEQPHYYSALAWKDIEMMSENNISFEPHTVSHPILSLLDKTEQLRQIKGSIEAIKSHLHTEPKVFCYPNGKAEDFNDETIEILQSEKIMAACTAYKDFFSPDYGKQLYRIPRVPFPLRYEQFVPLVSGFSAYRGFSSSRSKPTV